MKQQIKKLLYPLLMAFISIGISFNTEARLPKYMAQRAAELLIEKSELQLKSTTLINDDYLKLKENVILPSIASALPKYTEEDNIQNFITSIIKNMNQAKCEHKTEIERFTKAISNKNIQLRLIVAIQALNKANEQFTEQVALALKDAIIANEQAIYAHKLVDFLYSTEKRQHLANWMKNRIERGKIKTVHVTDEEGTVNHFIDLFNSISEVYNDNGDFRTFVNQHFPCWTGTMTCFMLNNEAHKLLVQGNITDSCRIKLGTTKSAHKIVSILFVLELIDNWNDIKQICKIGGETDDLSRLNVPSFEEIDPYDCVPVPNTAYEIENIYNGTCLLSTTRNLLCILKGRAPNFENFNIKTEVMEYFKKFESLEQLTAIPGITNIDEQNRWAGTLLAIRNLHFPDLKGFIDTLIGLIKHITLQDKVFTLYDGAELQKYRDNFNFDSGMQYGKINPDILNPLITQILMHITSGKHAISAQIREATLTDKKTRTWPVLILEIQDKTINKTIIIGIGNVGRGQHIEIINIIKLS